MREASRLSGTTSRSAGALQHRLGYTLQVFFREAGPAQKAEAAGKKIARNLATDAAVVPKNRGEQRSPRPALPPIDLPRVPVSLELAGR